MANIKDIINLNQLDLSQYTQLDSSSLDDWTIDYSIIKKSQFLIYIAQEKYIELLQVGKKSLLQAKKIIIQDPSHSKLFSQMTEDLQLVEGEDLSKEINHLIKNKKLDVDIEKSNESTLVLHILEGEDHSNERNS